MNVDSRVTSNLLVQIYQDIEEHEQKKRFLGQSYNIFSVLEVASKEVVMCRMLADLLSPDGAHGQGIRFLKSFVEQVLGIEGLDDDFYHSAEVEKEYCIPQSCSGRDNRRIDIVIQGGNLFLPIEVKISASDQDSQCFDYYKYAEQRMGAGKARVYYLTRFGTSPSELSLRLEMDPCERVPDNGIIKLSFKYHISRWLQDIIDMEQEGRVKTLLTQYLEAIDGFTGKISEEEGRLVAKRILKDSSSFAAAIQVVKAIDLAKVTLMKTLMDEIREEMEPILPKYGLQYLGQDSYYSVENQVESFYDQAESSYPGLNYLVRNGVLKDGKQVWFRIEIEWRLFAGFCLFDPKAYDGEGFQVDDKSEWNQEISRLFENGSPILDKDWWIFWRYLPNGTRKTGRGEDESPDFKTVNDAVIRLADDDYRYELIKRCVRTIEKELLSRLK